MYNVLVHVCKRMSHALRQIGGAQNCKQHPKSFVPRALTNALKMHCQLYFQLIHAPKYKHIWIGANTWHIFGLVQTHDMFGLVGRATDFGPCRYTENNGC